MQRRKFLQAIGLGTTVILVSPEVLFARQKDVKNLFVDGDVVMLIGDSITHDGRWHTFVRNYYLTRFPKANITFINSATSGDSTTSVLNRMNEDILIHRPNKIAIMLGMNNTGSSIYNSGKIKEEIEIERLKRIKLYQDEMNKIVAILKDNYQPQFIFITPTIYDQTAKIPQAAEIGRNDTLKIMSDFVKQQADKENALLVDFYEQMQNVNIRVQAKDPSKTIVGNDRVHPGYAGHHLMAYTFLKAQGVTESISEAFINWRSVKAKVEFAQISDLKIAKEQLSFNLLEQALPYPIAPDAQQVLDWVPIHQLNKQIVRVKGVPQGKYLLCIDNKPIGEFTSEELKKGIDLAGNTKTPQYHQAQALYIKTMAAAVKVSTQRTLFMVSKMVEKEKIDPKDTEALKQYQSRMKAISGWHGSIVSTYIKYASHPETLSLEIKDIEQEIKLLKKPQLHHYILHKM